MDLASGLGLAGFIAVNLAAAMTGRFFRPGEWYERLAKPWWRPPNWLFPPAWAVLYLTIAVSGWLVWREAGFAGAAVPLAVYAVQLVVNAAWSAVFFGLRRIDLAFANLVLLWLSIAATIAAFHPVHAGAAWLLVPYLAWVTFAGALNFAILRLNPAGGVGARA
jgi:tryptophan-rich sensory protein